MDKAHEMFQRGVKEESLKCRMQVAERGLEGSKRLFQDSFRCAEFSGLGLELGLEHFRSSAQLGKLFHARLVLALDPNYSEAPDAGSKRHRGSSLMCCWEAPRKVVPEPE
jgi:hypothetical protein